MRLRIGTAVAAVLLCACGTSSARPAGGSAGTGGGAEAGGGAGHVAAGVPCGAPQAQTLAASRFARVYSRNRRVYGCAHGSAHQYLLGGTSCSPTAPAIAPVAVAARLTAYGSLRCGIDTGTSEVVLERLGDGAVLDHKSATTAQLRPETYVQVTAIVLARDRAFAWISTARSVAGGGAYATEVLARDRHGMRQLDSGAGIATGSLRLSGRTLRWRDGGRMRSATLA